MTTFQHHNCNVGFHDSTDGTENKWVFPFGKDKSLLVINLHCLIPVKLAADMVSFNNLGYNICHCTNKNNFVIIIDDEIGMSHTDTLA
jgi:hypothetical protein